MASTLDLLLRNTRRNAKFRSTLLRLLLQQMDGMTLRMLRLHQRLHQRLIQRLIQRLLMCRRLTLLYHGNGLYKAIGRRDLPRSAIRRGGLLGLLHSTVPDAPHLSIWTISRWRMAKSTTFHRFPLLQLVGERTLGTHSRATTSRKSLATSSRGGPGTIRATIRCSIS